MDYKRFGQSVVIRMDPDEEITGQLQLVAQQEGIVLASVTALGAVKDFEVGVYDLTEKKYYPNRFQGAYEIVSLTGTVNTMDGAYYAHLHMSASTRDGVTVGGHLRRAVVSATCEMVLTVIDGTVDRRTDPVTGLNIFDFREV